VLVRRAVAAALFVALCCAGAEAAARRGRITGLKVREDVGHSIVEVHADRPLSFTTLRLSGPPRVVLDFPDAEVEGVAREQEIEGGAVKRVGAAAVGAKTARVVIELFAEAEFDVRALGPRLDVRIAHPAEAPAAIAAQAAPAFPEPQQTPAAQAGADEPPESGARQREEQPAREQAIAQQAEQEAQARAAAERAKAEKEARAAERAKAEQERAALAKAEQEAERAKAEKEQAALAKAEQEAREAERAKADEARAAAERAKADAAARAGAEAAARAGAEAAEQPAVAARLADDDPRKSLPTVSLAGQGHRPRPLPEPPPPSDARAVARSEAHAEAGSERRAEAPAAAGEPPAAETASASIRTEQAEPHREPPRFSITGIGFRPGGGGAVLVRSDRPLEYGVSGEERAVLLHLRGAEIKRPNDRLPLDTRFFGGAVARVVPLVVPGGVDLRIELRSAAGYQLQQGEGVLSVTFASVP
jgi:AMIN domain